MQYTNEEPGERGGLGVGASRGVGGVVRNRGPGRLAAWAPSEAMLMTGECLTIGAASRQNGLELNTRLQHEMAYVTGRLARHGGRGPRYSAVCEAT
jgi:hypothetical protein